MPDGAFQTERSALRAAVVDLENLKRRVLSVFLSTMHQIGPVPNFRQGEEVALATIYAESYLGRDSSIYFIFLVCLEECTEEL